MKINTGLVALIGPALGFTLLLAGCGASAPAEVETASSSLELASAVNTEPEEPWVPNSENCTVLFDELAMADPPIRNQIVKLDSYAECRDAWYGTMGEDGEIDYVFGVTDDEPLTSANTTADPRTPATLKDVAEICGRVLTWKALRDCILEQDDVQWYIDAINERGDEEKEELKFTWDDINTWADDPQLNTPTATQVLIQVYGEGYTLDEIEQMAAEIVGPTMAAKLIEENKIAYHPAGFMNTSSTDKEVYDFYDGRTMVRVSLAPVVYNEKGEFLELNPDSGIFLDCGNLWWIPKIVWVCEDSSCTPPPPCPPGNTKPECAPKSGDASVGYWVPDGITIDLGAGDLTGTVDVDTETGTGGGGVTTGSGDGAGTETGTESEGAGSVGTDERDTNTNEGAGGNNTDLGGFD